MSSSGSSTATSSSTAELVKDRAGSLPRPRLSVSARQPRIARPVSDPVISIRGLRKSYGELEAVRGIDLEVRAGEVFAFLGPNGAGKTTTVEILEGYRERSGGEVAVLGEDPQRARARLARADRDRPAELPARPLPDRARVARALRRLLPHIRARSTR